MAYKLQLKRGLLSALPIGISGEPLFTTDTNDLYISNGTTNQKFQKFIASGTSSQFLKGDGSLDSNTYYLSSNPSAYITLTALTASSPLSYNNTTGAFTISQASGSVNGYLSSTDWNTFNNKQNTITNPVTGTGTTNYLPKWTSVSALGNSNLFNDANGNIGLGVTPSAWGSFSNALQIGATASFFGRTGTTEAVGVSSNAILNSSGVYNYIINGSASLYESYSGSHRWYNAPSGTAGSNITSFNQAMTLTSGGNLLVGITTDSGEKLQVSGSVKATGSLYMSAPTGFGTFISFKNDSNTTGFDIGHLNGAGAGAYIYQRANQPIIFGTNNVDVLTLASTGAATFSSDVTVSGVLKETVTTNRQIASYTLALADRGKLVEMNVATANNLTVPLNSSIAFPIGTKIDLAQYGAGQTTVVATSGVTVRSAGGALKLTSQYSGATLVKIATDEWYLFGNITV